VLSLLLAVAAQGQLSYTNTFRVQTPNDPGAIATADFNRDGKPDFAVLQGPILSVFFNLGSGKFGGRKDTTIPSDSYLIEAADVNNDGHIDVVLAEFNTPDVLVLLGNGDGTFKSPIHVGLAAIPRAIALGDFNKDGKVDLAVTECAGLNTPCDIAVFLGNGNGTFTLTKVLNTPRGANTPNLIATDFNRDGNLDLATVAVSPSRALVFFGLGNGDFKSPIALTVKNPLPPQSVEAIPTLASGDFNGDGVPDLVVMAGFICGAICGGASISPFLSNGSGGFTLIQPSVHNQFGPENFQVGDLNNDQRQDVVTLNASLKAGRFDYWLGNGTGTFSSATSSFNLDRPGGVQIRDMNLDGRHDLIASDLSSPFSPPTVWAEMNQNGTPNCAPPPSNAIHAKICAPGASTSSSTFTVRASGNSPVGIQRLELWVDGVKKFQTLNDQLRKTLTLSPGTHRLVVVAVDAYIGKKSSVKFVKVP
jgi:hypothetical protein